MKFLTMKNKTWMLHILCYVIQLSLHDCSSAYTTHSTNLFNVLTRDYNSNIRPDDNVPVAVSFAVSSINDLDVETGKFSVTGWFSVSWTDLVYVWTPSSYGNVEYLFLTTEYCWKPQIAINNAVDELKILNDDSQQMRVKYDGMVVWEPGGVFHVHCDVDISYFPFDKQTCYISLSSAVYDNTAVTLAHYSTSIKTDSIVNNAEWTVSETSTETESRLDGRGDLPKTFLRFTFKLERNSSFYVWTLMLPYFLISCLGLVVFLLPPTKGEKISFSLTVIFLVVIFFIIFSTLLPLSKGKLPVIGIYFLLLLILNVFELLMSAVVERLHRNNSDERPMSSKVHSITHKLLSRITCYRNGSPNISSEYSTKPLYPRRFSMPKNTRVSPSSLPQIASSANVTPPRPKNGHQSFDRLNSAQSATATSDFDRMNSAKSTRTVSDFTISTDTSNASSTLPLHSSPIEYTWKDIACMVDRISLIVFSILDILLTSIFIAIFNL